jgi:hypothetical protein
MDNELFIKIASDAFIDEIEKIAGPNGVKWLKKFLKNSGKSIKNISEEYTKGMGDLGSYINKGAK